MPSVLFVVMVRIGTGLELAFSISTRRLAVAQFDRMVKSVPADVHVQLWRRNAQEGVFTRGVMLREASGVGRGLTMSWSGSAAARRGTDLAECAAPVNSTGATHRRRA